VLRQSQLSALRAPDRIDLRRLDAVVSRRLLLQRMSLAVIPGGRSKEQQIVLHWANHDTEHTADQIWTAPDGADSWDTDLIVTWSLDRRRWSDHDQPAERIVIMFDGHLYVALAPAAADVALASLHALAAGWGLRVIEGRQGDAWI
jgi:hypothetical protein